MLQVWLDAHEVNGCHTINRTTMAMTPTPGLSREQMQSLCPGSVTPQAVQGHVPPSCLPLVPFTPPQGW